MNVTLTRDAVQSIEAEWLVVGVYEGEEGLSSPARALDEASNGLLSRLRVAGDFSGKADELTALVGVSGPVPERVLLVGLGKREELDAGRISQAARTAAKYIAEKKRSRVAFALLEDESTDGRRRVAAAVEGAIVGSHGPDLYKAERKRHAFEELLIVPGAGLDDADLQGGIHRGQVLGEAVNLARDLVNQPPQVINPTTFAERAATIAQEREIHCTIFDEEQIRRERMGALLGVAAGSDQPPRFVILEYGETADSQAPCLALVGKGLTFDSGGLSLKPSTSMEDMKCDMAGAATVLAAMQAIAQLQPPVRVLGIAALSENMPGPRAMKLGDVLTARNGKTIEVLNTDAEGRLVLADALSYAVDRRANHIIDLATLTGSCVVALGQKVVGLMTNNQAWADRVREAADRVGERTWQLPMFDDYSEQIKSDVADMKNVGTRWGGAITAAKLLENFVAKVPWVHLDIAGPAWASEESTGQDSGGTGVMVRTLVEVVESYSG